MAGERASGRHIMLTAAIAAMGGLLFGYDTGVIGSAMLFIKTEFALSAFEQGLVVGLVPVGAIFGALASAALSDKYGRKAVITAASLVFIAGTTLAALSDDVIALGGGRLAIGVAIGFASACCPVYISEVAPKEIRGRLVTLFQLAVTVGILIAYLAGAGLSASGDWRAMVAIGIVPAFVLLIGMVRMPQSPRWLVMIGAGSEARKALLYLHPDDTEEQLDEEIEEIRAGLSTESGSYAELVSPLVRMALFVGVGLAILQQVTGINTVIYYAPTIFNLAGIDSSTSAILAGGGVALVNVFATIWALRLVSQHGRRTLLLVGVSGMTISLMVLGAAFELEGGGVVATVAIVSLMVYVLSFAISLGPIFWILNGELYPTRARSKAAGLATTANWLFNFIVSLTFLTLIGALGTTGTFWLYAAISLLTIGFVARFVPETKGRSLEEIENDWRGRVGLEPLGASPTPKS